MRFPVGRNLSYEWASILSLLKREHFTVWISRFGLCKTNKHLTVISQWKQKSNTPIRCDKCIMKTLKKNIVLEDRTMRRQTTQYSFCISVTQFTFYTVNSKFYMVKSTFYMVRSTFYMVRSTFYIGQCKTQTVDFRLQTGGKVQTEGKMQTEDCRSGVKSRLGSKRINCLWPRYRPDREAQERSVERLEANASFQDHAYLRSVKQRYEKQVALLLSK